MYIDAQYTINDRGAISMIEKQVRKRKAEDVVLGNYINLRLNNKEYEALRNVAFINRTKMATIIRGLIDKYLEFDVKK